MHVAAHVMLLAESGSSLSLVATRLLSARNATASILKFLHPDANNIVGAGDSTNDIDWSL
jgi:hypothetical protein